MIKLYSVLLLILPPLTLANPGDENNYEAYIVLRNPSTPNLKYFPFDKKKSPEDDVIIEKHLCPAETNKDVRNIEQASKNDYKLKYCLFEKHFKYGEDKVCKKEVKPVLIEIKEKCGWNQYGWHAFSNFDCGIIDDQNDDLKKFLKKQLQKNPFLNEFPRRDRYFYKICYDTYEKRVMWTKHEIQTSELLQNSHLKNQQLSTTELLEISTNAYFMDDSLFLVLKKRYESEKNKDTSSGNFIMVPRPLVPLEHLALVHWKKTANHYMNMAPLWETLVPLMTAIDERVQKLQQELASRDPNSYSKLQIYTKVDLALEANKTQKSRTWFNLKTFEGNIWYKFIYLEKEKSGALLIIHNTPGKPPSASKGCIMGIEKPCQFENWSEDENINRDVTDEVKKYAYCCLPWRHDILDLFAYDPAELENFLNMDPSLEPKTSAPNSPEEGRMKKRVKTEDYS